jgi:ABC-2 type transport system permease protein
MRKLLAVAVKEMRQIRRDPLSLLMLLGLPAFLLVLYGFALNFDVRHVALAVQDRDHTAQSRGLVDAFVKSTYFDLVAAPPPGTRLEGLTERGKALAILVIPERYGEDLADGRAAQVQLLLDGADATTATTILGYAGAVVSEVNAESLRETVVRVAGSELAEGISYRPRVWYNPELSSTRFLVPGLMGVLLMLTAVLATALSIVREKERGTIEQIRVAPIRTLELILGKTLPYLLISFAASGIILLAARVLFGVDVKGPYLALAAATLLYLVGALGLGILISTAAESQAVAFQGGLLVSLLPAMLLSGFIFQISAMPRFLQVITYAIPARYYLVILRGVIIKGAGLAPYPGELVGLTVFAIATLGLATLRLVREEA